MKEKIVPPSVAVSMRHMVVNDCFDRLMQTTASKASIRKALEMAYDAGVTDAKIIGKETPDGENS